MNFIKFNGLCMLYTNYKLQTFLQYCDFFLLKKITNFLNPSEPRMKIIYASVMENLSCMEYSLGESEFQLSESSYEEE